MFLSVICPTRTEVGQGLGADLECPIPVGAMATNIRLQAAVVLEEDRSPPPSRFLVLLLQWQR